MLVHNPHLPRVPLDDYYGTFLTSEARQPRIVTDGDPDVWARLLIGSEGPDGTNRIVSCPPTLAGPLAPVEAHARLRNDLLIEAVCARSGTIPANAFVEIRVPPFIGVHLVESRDAVYFAWEHEKGAFFLLFFDLSNPDALTISAGSREFQADMVRVREHEQVEAWRCYDPAYVQEVMRVRTMERWNDESITALEFLSAAIVRDFWVVEDRGDALRLGAPRFRQALGAADTRKRVIYLPRCRYDRRHVERAVAGEAATWRVSPHFVGPHFRTLPDGHTATRKQRAVAALHGVAIPTGKTWVRGHVAAGGEEEAKVFRSRTACRTLLEVLDLTRPSNALRGLSWYQFERLCERLIEERGYAVVDKVGDNGIDILAADVAGHTLLGQAKHWTKPVGPGVVRDMVGARAAFVRDQGGDAAAMILSSSGFTASARADAAAAGIELVTVSTR